MPDTDTSTETPETPCLRHAKRHGNPWCTACQAAIYDAIGHLPTLHDRLLDTDGQDTRAKLIGGRTSIDPPSPSPRYDHADEIARTLRTWAEAWADHLGEQYGGREPRNAATYLLRHRRNTSLLTSPLAADLGYEITALHNTALRMLGGDETERGETHTRLDGAVCPDCNGSTHYRIDGTDTVRCGMHDCGAETTYDDWLAIAEDQQRRRQLALAGSRAA